MTDYDALAGSVVQAAREYVGRAVAGVQKRIEGMQEELTRLENRVAEMPVPKDGRDGINGTNGIDGKDGVGKDGRDGRDGQPGRDGEKGEAGHNGIDGLDGKDGADGLGFDDLSVVYDGERSFVLKFQRGERTREFTFRLPIVLDRGVFKADAAYERGDGVTYGGSFHIAQKDAPEGKPGFGGDWRLAVKRGQDGKDGLSVIGEKPAQLVRLR